MTDNITEDQATLEREVVRTQDAMGDTVEKLEEKMNPRDITRSVLGDEGTDVAREAIEVTRQNPIPVALIAVGLIWILATSRSPMITRITDRFTGRRSASPGEPKRPPVAHPAPIGPATARRGDPYDRRPMASAGI